MNTKYALLSLVLALVLVSPVVVLATGGTDDPTHHEELAASYEQKAVAQDALILQHEQMKLDASENVAKSPKSGTAPVVKAMEKHCNAIIDKAKELKAEFLDFAKWHHMRAAELQGR